MVGTQTNCEEKNKVRKAPVCWALYKSKPKEGDKKTTVKVWISDLTTSSSTRERRTATTNGSFWSKDSPD